jgi:hypothetical protein
MTKVIETIDITFENVYNEKDNENLQHVCVILNIPDSEYSYLIYYLTHRMLRTKHQYSIEKPQEKYSTP